MKKRGLTISHGRSLKIHKLAIIVLISLVIVGLEGCVFLRGRTLSSTETATVEPATVEPATVEPATSEPVIVETQTPDVPLEEVISYPEVFLQTWNICFAGQREGNYEIFASAEDGSGLFNLTNNEYDDNFPSWSSQAKLLAFASTRDGNSEIYLMDLNQGVDENKSFPVTRLTEDDSLDTYPSISPDGSKIAFVSDRSGNKEIYLMNSDGSGLVQLTYDGDEDNYPAFSPDNEQIAFASRRAGNFDIYVMNSDGTAQDKLTSGTENKAYPAWSPDDSRMAFTTFIDNNEVYIVNLDGSGLANISNDPSDDHNASWSADGQSLVFVSDRSGNPEIYTIGIDDGNLRRITNNTLMDDTPVFLK